MKLLVSFALKFVRGSGESEVFSLYIWVLLVFWYVTVWEIWLISAFAFLLVQGEEEHRRRGRLQFGFRGEKETGAFCTFFCFLYCLFEVSFDLFRFWRLAAPILVLEAVGFAGSWIRFLLSILIDVLILDVVCFWFSAMPIESVSWLLCISGCCDCKRVFGTTWAEQSLSEYSKCYQIHFQVTFG